MASKRRAPAAASTGGQRDRLLSEDHSEIKLVPAADREWWARLSRPAKARFAARRNKKWTDEETKTLILADPDRDDYYVLGAALGRAPGAVRLRRSLMVHLLKNEYGYVEKALDYLADPKAHHKWADIGQVYRVLREMGILGDPTKEPCLPVSEQMARARHLRQPSGSWRGDNTSAVLREQRATAADVRARLAKLRGQAAGGRKKKHGP